METTTRRQVPALIRQLLERPQEFTFLQAVRLLDSLAAASGEQQRHARPGPGLRFRPKLSLDFPPTDLDRIEQDEKTDDRYRITVNFLGLYGTSSPLPAFYTEELFDDESEEIGTTREFLDIINNALYRLFFTTSTRYHLPYKAVEERDRAILDRLYALSGFASPSLRRSLPEAASLLRHTGIFTQQPRSAGNLRCLVADTIGSGNVEIEQCRASRLAIPDDQRCRLGTSGNRLGSEAHLGGSVRSRSSSFRIMIGPLEGRAYRNLLPGTPLAALLAERVGLFIDQPLTWDVELRVASTALKGIRLGSSAWNRPGMDAWLGRPVAAGATTTATFLPHRLESGTRKTKQPST